MTGNFHKACRVIRDNAAAVILMLYGFAAVSGNFPAALMPASIRKTS